MDRNLPFRGCFTVAERQMPGFLAILYGDVIIGWGQLCCNFTLFVAADIDLQCGRDIFYYSYQENSTMPLKHKHAFATSVLALTLLSIDMIGVSNAQKNSTRTDSKNVYKVYVKGIT